MDITYIKLTDADLVDLAKEEGTTKEAKREIRRRKMVGFWDGTAQIKWKIEPEWEEEEDEQASEETVY